MFLLAKGHATSYRWRGGIKRIGTGPCYSGLNHLKGGRKVCRCRSLREKEGRDRSCSNGGKKKRRGTLEEKSSPSFSFLGYKK